MSLVITAARKLKINPDNIATPIAASVGDIVTLGILEKSARHIYEEMGEQLIN
jgi:solute carrier family 41